MVAKHLLTQEKYERQVANLKAAWQPKDRKTGTKTYTLKLYADQQPKMDALLAKAKAKATERGEPVPSMAELIRRAVDALLRDQ